MTKAALLLVIPANLPGDTGLSPWNRRAPPGSALAKVLFEKTCAVSFEQTFFVHHLVGAEHTRSCCQPGVSLVSCFSPDFGTVVCFFPCISFSLVSVSYAAAQQR